MTKIDGLTDKSEDIVVFDPVTFLVIQLPPIIFNSGYHIDRSMCEYGEGVRLESRS